MSKKIISQVFITLLMLGLYSCGNNGNKSNSEEVEADSIFIHVGLNSFSKDDLSKALKEIIRVNYDDYLLENDGDDGLKFTVVFKGHSLGNHEKAMAKLSSADLELALLDDNNTDFCNERFRLDGISLEKLLEWTLSARSFDKKEVTFVCSNISNIKEVKSRAKEVRIFVVGNSSSYADSDMSDSSDDDDELSESSSGTEDWDAILDSYERMVDKYIAYANKVADGDTNVMTEAASIMEEAQEYADKLKNANDNLSSSQLSRLNRISAKMAKAAAELQMKLQ